MQIGPYTITRGTMVPYQVDDETRQVKLEAEDGSVTVTEPAFNSVRFMRPKIKVPQAEAVEIANFLLAVGYARDTFTYVDGFGTSHTVRYWDKKIRQRNIAGGLVEMDILLRREV
jgi:hypothetical protein